MRGRLLNTPPASYRLGIDTGGTFTDAVLLDANQRVLASAKCLTTRFDLAQGIGQALGQLPAALLRPVGLVGLSTTLTTNAVVEGKGAPVCVLLAGYDAAQIQASGLAELLGVQSIESLCGGHDASGNALAPLDEAAARAAIARQAPRVAGFAVSATFSVRNPAHELQLRAWVQALCDKPVTCGHELASNLGAPRRAATAALNARMVSHSTALISAVQRSLQAHGIRAPLMVMQGDGTLVNVRTALERPLHTVLSGPAASVLGACALSGLRNAVVADMGGTTTDIALVRNGQAALSPDGARIGPWRPMVEAVQVSAIGLGGDSEVRLGGGEGLVIGPRRVLPLSLLAHQHPAVLDTLRRQQHEPPHASQMRFVQRLQADPALLAHLSDDEQHAWDALAAGPVDLEHANLHQRRLARALARLERKGLALYSGFTPSDAAHVLGLSQHWSTPAAHCAAIIWARQMRQLYGLGTWPLGDAHAPAQAVVDAVNRSICEQLVEAALHDAQPSAAESVPGLARILTRMALQAADAQHNAGQTPALALQFAPHLPLVAVGAPAASYYPRVAQSLGVQYVVPPHAEVANAVGAVLGPVAQRAHITVSQWVRGVFRVFTAQGPQDFDNLPVAMARAEEAACQTALALALRAGAANPEVRTSHSSNHVRNDIDGEVFFEACVTATATGAPAVGAAAEAGVVTEAGGAGDAAEGAAV